MEAGDWISVLMVLIATASTVVTYAVYRTATDPEVIVYADADPKRPSVINLIIKNIGNGPATDIEFIPERPLPSKAYGIEVPKEMPEEMKDGPIIVGIPYLAPDQQLVITWGQYGGLKKYIGSSPISITVKYKRARNHPPYIKHLESQSKLDIHSFEGTDASDHNWGPKLVKTLKDTNEELSKINSAINTLSDSNES